MSIDLYNELIKYVQEKERVCPLPNYWSELYNMLHDNPANPLILGGWASSNYSKKTRFFLHISTVLDQGLIEDFDSFIRALKEEEWHHEYDYSPSHDTTGMFWNYEHQPTPSTDQLESSLSELITNWSRIVSKELSPITYPIKFTGEKGRRLIVEYKKGSLPTWGTWTELSSDKNKRLNFTQFRSSINDAIKPHDVDHIDFFERKNS